MLQNLVGAVLSFDAFVVRRAKTRYYRQHGIVHVYLE